MNVQPRDSTPDRLRRLTAYLQEDPHNTHLLAEACDAALACGRHDAAEAFLATADRVAPHSPAVQLRRVHVCIARGALDEALALLEDLRGRTGHHPVLLHDLAYLHLLRGDAQAAHDLLADTAAQGFAEPGAPQELLQAQWLRACHHLGRLEQARDWAAHAQAAHALRPAAAGVASLVALDLDDQDAARTWADAALAADPHQHEALVARGCAAITAGELGEGATYLERALERHPQDGRTWSSLGLASLLASDLPRARQQLERAVALAPAHAPSWQALGWALLLLGEREQALDALRRSVEHDGASAETHAALALALAFIGDAGGAQPVLERAESLDPQDEVAALARACLDGKGGTPDLQPALQRLLAQWRPRP